MMVCSARGGTATTTAEVNHTLPELFWQGARRRRHVPHQTPSSRLRQQTPQGCGESPTRTRRSAAAATTCLRIVRAERALVSRLFFLRRHDIVRMARDIGRYLRHHAQSVAAPAAYLLTARAAKSTRRSGDAPGLRAVDRPEHGRFDMKAASATTRAPRRDGSPLNLRSAAVTTRPPAFRCRIPRWCVLSQHDRHSAVSCDARTSALPARLASSYCQL